jgi:hypothetical protein
MKCNRCGRERFYDWSFKNFCDACVRLILREWVIKQSEIEEMEGEFTHGRNS